MPRIAYFQPSSGTSGDMTLGALLDAGLSLESLEKGLGTLGLPGWRLHSERVMRGPFQATRLKVVLEARPQRHDRAHEHSHAHDHGSGHSHAHSHSHGQGHDPGHAHGHEHGAGSGERNLPEILRIIDASGLPAGVKVSAARVFRRLGEAEARVHGISVDTVRFHEVGAIDSIVDITGSCLGLHLLGVDEVHSAPVTVGTGHVHGAHGTMPLPAPATIELLKGFPIEQRDSRAELTTPTGAAILTALAKSFGTLPPMTVRAVGYGAGDDRPGPVPNVLRVILGESAAAPSPATDARPGQGDRVVVLETHVDDMSPEWTGHLVDRLLEAGAYDVALTPILMKKSRPAQEVKVILPAEAEGRVLATLFRESTTLGVRRTEADRVVLERELRPVETPWGRVHVKLGRFGGDVVTASPEYEELRAAAARANLPLKEVHARVMDLFRAAGPASR